MYQIGSPDLFPIFPSLDQLSPLGIEFIKRCLTKDANVRESALELLQSEFCMVPEEDLKALENWIILPNY